MWWGVDEKEMEYVEKNRWRGRRDEGKKQGVECIATKYINRTSINNNNIIIIIIIVN